MGKGEKRGGGYPPDVQKSAPPRPTTYLLLFPSLTGWRPEAAKKNSIFVQNCQNFAFFWRLSRKFSGFVFYSLPFPPLERRNLFPPPGGPKTTAPPCRNLADPPPSCRPHAHLWLTPLTPRRKRRRRKRRRQQRRPGAGGPRTAPTAHHFLPRPPRSSSVYERLGSLRWRTYPLGTVQGSLDTRTRTELERAFFSSFAEEGEKEIFSPSERVSPQKTWAEKLCSHRRKLFF